MMKLVVQLQIVRENSYFHDKSKAFSMLLDKKRKRTSNFLHIIGIKRVHIACL